MKHNTSRALAFVALCFPFLVGFGDGGTLSKLQPASTPQAGDTYTLLNTTRDSSKTNILSTDTSVQRIVQTGVSIGGYNDVIFAVETQYNGKKDSIYARYNSAGDIETYTADTTNSVIPHWLTYPFVSHIPQSYTQTSADTVVQSFDTITLTVTYAGTETLIIKGATVSCDIVYLTYSEHGVYGGFGSYEFSSVSALSYSSAIGWTTHSRAVSFEPPTSGQTFDESLLIDYSSGGGGGNLTVQATAPVIPNTPVDSSSPNLALQIANTGTLAWMPGTPNIDNSNFVYISGGNLAIPAGGKDSILVRFTPQSVGANVSILTFPNSTPKETPALSLTLLGQGTKPQSGSVSVQATLPQVPSTQVGDTSAALSLELKNTGTLSWTPGTPMLNNADFIYISGGDATIPAGAVGTILFRFAPGMVGTNSTLVTFPNSSPAESPTLSVTLSGQGTPTQGVASVVAADGYSLSPNYPNPFNPTTKIGFSIPAAGLVRMDLIDATGRLVRTLLDRRMDAGSHAIAVDGSNLSSGVYEYRLMAGARTFTRRMVLAK